MEEKELEELLARDTVLVLDTIIEEPDAEPVEMLYYEYAMQQYYAKMRTRATYPAKASGYWTTQIVKTNAVGTPVQTASITFKISPIQFELLSLHMYNSPFHLYSIYFMYDNKNSDFIFLKNVV